MFRIYNPVRVGTKVTKVLDVLNALGIIAFAFRGHNLYLILEKVCCLFPLAIRGYWALWSIGKFSIL